MVHLHDIVEVLHKYQGRYGCLDVRASDVAELNDATADEHFEAVGDDVWRTEVGDQALQVQLYPERNIARFELVRGHTGAGGGVLVGAAAGAALGAAIAGSDREGSAPAGAVFGLLVGGLLGAAVGAMADQPRASRKVLTLRYDEEAGEWRVYHGPYVSWAKGALRAS